jgi:hypothetical protein
LLVFDFGDEFSPLVDARVALTVHGQELLLDPIAIERDALRS